VTYNTILSARPYQRHTVTNYIRPTNNERMRDFTLTVCKLSAAAIDWAKGSSSVGINAGAVGDGWSPENSSYDIG
jgi:hypothetical protein